MDLINLAVMVVSLATLVASSHVAIRKAVKVAELTKTSTSRVGFTLIALSTSLPELAVAIFSAYEGEVGVSIGNVLGSNVFNICAIVGSGLLLAYVLKRGKVSTAIVALSEEEMEMMYFGMFIASVVPIAIVSLLPASPLVGTLLVSIFMYYTVKVLFSSKNKVPEKMSDEVGNSMRKEIVMNTVLALLGVIGVIVSADLLVDSAVKFALDFGVPPSAIAATFIAGGTSLPELALDLHAILRGEAGLAGGDIVGSCFTNITLILGVSLLLSPVRIDTRVFSDLVMFSTLSSIVLWYLMGRGRLGGREGIYLLALFALYLTSVMGIIVLR
ncbi:MAG: hypothetical protein QXF26_01140 [Candidatus Bathyarchaeia archaeon]